MSDISVQFKEAIKHRWVKVGLMIIAALGIILIVRARMGSNAQTVNSASGLSDAQAADQTQLQMQQNAISAASANQNSAIAAAQASQQEQDTTALSALTIQAQTQLAALLDTNKTQAAENQNNNETQVSLANVQLEGLKSQYENLTQQQLNQLNSEVSLANIQAAENETINAANANVQINASNNQLAAAISSNNAQVGIAQANNSGGGGCFITTAVCESSHKPDDCRELKTLRAYRDRYIAITASGRAWIALYYFAAPMIVTKLNALPKARREEAYHWLNEFIQLAVKQITECEYEKARKTYFALFSIACKFANQKVSA